MNNYFFITSLFFLTLLADAKGEYTYLEVLDYQDNLLNHELAKLPESKEEISMKQDFAELLEDENYIEDTGAQKNTNNSKLQNVSLDQVFINSDGDIIIKN